jgi:hypothetical protein
MTETQVAIILATNQNRRPPTISTASRFGAGVPQADPEAEVEVAMAEQVAART